MLEIIPSILMAAALSQVNPAAADNAAAEQQPAAEQQAEKASADKATLEESAAKSAEAAEKAAAAAQSAADTAAKLAAAFDELSAALKNAKPGEAPAPAAAPAEKTEASKWSGLVGVSLISMTGNTNSLTATANLALRREDEKWIFQFKADGAYGRTRPKDILNEETGEYEEADPETVALNAKVEARGDFRFTKMISIYAAAGSKTDHVNSVEAMNYGEAGLSVIWFDRKEGDFTTLRLQTDIAFRAGKELRFNYYPTMFNVDDEIVAAPRFALAFRYAITDGLIFTEDLEVLPNVVGDSRVWVTSLTKLSLKLYKTLSFTASFLVKHDSNPVDDKKATDTVLTLGLELGF